MCKYLMYQKVSSEPYRDIVAGSVPKVRFG